MAKTCRKIKVQWEFEKADDAEARIEAAFDIIFGDTIDDEVFKKNN